MGGQLNFKKSTVEINLSVNNLLNETYISHLSALKIDDIPNPGRNVMLGFNFNFM
jgi:iron complex outermembrane receptor protein